MAMPITADIEHPKDMDTTRNGVETVLREQVTTLQRSAERLSESTDSEAVHELRGAARRLRSALKLYESSFPKRLQRRSSKALKRLARVPDSLRTWDSHHDLLLRLYESAGGEAEKAALEHVLEHVDEQRATRRDELLDELEDLDLPRLTATLERLTKKQTRKSKGAKRRLREASKVFEKLVSAVGELPEQNQESSLEDSQRARGALRRLRHALEVSESSVEGLSEIAKPVKELEQLLGDGLDRSRTLLLLEERRAQLAGGGRSVLSDGLSSTIERLTQERRGLADRFGKRAKSFDREKLAGEVQRALGVEPEALA
jgi:CHAD domain-containing protein